MRRPDPEPCSTAAQCRHAVTPLAATTAHNADPPANNSPGGFMPRAVPRRCVTLCFQVSNGLRPRAAARLWRTTAARGRRRRALRGGRPRLGGDCRVLLIITYT
ncbi:hypothetical protein U9M48_022461 [Paspalum notatum var. saurae]|uniref:Uncharacterized protein n=1 Tax=Paspalum notatum var. saurae TaxID=547442 RepID=A0AAQ3TJR2_PASNO